MVATCGRLKWHLAGRRGERAIALPLAMIVTVVVITLSLAFHELSRMEAVSSTEDVNMMRAFAAAEFGLERARAMSSSQNCPWYVMTYEGAQLSFYPSSNPIYEGNYVCDLFADELVSDSPEATYSVVIEDRTDWLLTGGTYRIHAFGASGSRTHHITLDAQTITYSSFGWLTHSENDTYFATGDTVDGWVYTNDHLNIYGSPVFTGKVNSAASYVDYYHGGPPVDNPDFQQGLFLNSAPIDMAKLINSGHVSVVRDRAEEEDGILLGPNGGRPYIVDFTSDGKVTVQKKLPDGTWETVVDNRSLSATNGAIYIEDTVGVRGTVNGQVTLATPEDKDIYVLDDLVYAHPEDKTAPFRDGFDMEDWHFDDKLGLIAGRDIIVYKSWSGDWSDMYIMASLLAVEGSVRNYYHTSYGFKTLHILGGVAQFVRGPVGRTDNRGFLKDYEYDRRFYVDPPPHFPMVAYDYNTWCLDADPPDEW